MICPSEMLMCPSNVHPEEDNPIKLTGTPRGESEIIRLLARDLQRSRELGASQAKPKSDQNRFYQRGRLDRDISTLFLY